MHEKLADMGNLQKYLPLPYPPSMYSGLMGHMPFLLPNTSGTSSLFTGDATQLNAMRQLQHSLGQQRLMMDTLHESQDSPYINGGNPLIKSPKARRFTPYTVPSLSSADSAFYRMASGQLPLPSKPISNETDSPSTKDSPTKV